MFLLLSLRTRAALLCDDVVVEGSLMMMMGLNGGLRLVRAREAKERRRRSLSFSPSPPKPVDAASRARAAIVATAHKTK